MHATLEVFKADGLKVPIHPNPIIFPIWLTVLFVVLLQLGCAGSVKSGSSLSSSAVAPTIAWAAPAAITYGTALGATQLNATASTTGTFSYSPEAGTVIAAGSQTLSVTFTPANTTDYTTATASVTLTVSKDAPVVTWATPSAVTYGTALGVAQLDATTSTPGTFSYSPAGGTVPAAGSQTLSVTFTPSDTTDYATATASVSLAVSKAAPAITWVTPAAIAAGSVLSATQLDAAASTPGTFSYSPASGTVLAVGSQTLSVTFTPSNIADYTTVTASVTLTVSINSSVVTWATPAAITYGTALSAMQLDATANTPGTFTYSPAAGIVLAAGSQTLSVTFTPANTTNYSGATGSVILTVSKAAPTITWASPAPITYGTGLSTTQLDATASTPGTFNYSPAVGTVLAAGSQTLSVSFTPNNTADYTTATDSVTLVVNSSSPPTTLSLTTTACPGGTQGTSYSGCTLVATGGTTPYAFSVDTTGIYAPLPEGLILNPSTGVIGSSQIGGQGTYVTGLIVKDGTGDMAESAISFGITGSNAYLSSIFPSSSIFHHRVDAATTSLPVDTSPAAPIYSGYLSSTIKPFFGGEPTGNFPNGIPAFQIFYNQADVSVTTTMYQSYFTSGPIPANAPVEGTAYNVPSGDGHVLIYQQAGGSNPPALWEMWQGQLQPGGSWTDSSNALWSNISSNALTPQGNGTTDAAGLPVAPLLLNADEVIGTGTPTAPNGTVQHPTRFTMNHGLNYWVWPATQSAGVGSCDSIPVENLISQSSPPSSCSFSGAFGEIYRLKASVSTPSCAATSPQASIIITGFRNYGIIMADNGDTGGLIGTPDARWNDTDLSCLRNLTLADFEPVNVSSLQVAPDSGATH